MPFLRYVFALTLPMLLPTAADATDGAAKDPAYMTLKFSPWRTRQEDQVDKLNSATTAKPKGKVKVRSKQ